MKEYDEVGRVPVTLWMGSDEFSVNIYKDEDGFFWGIEAPMGETLFPSTRRYDSKEAASSSMEHFYTGSQIKLVWDSEKEAKTVREILEPDTTLLDFEDACQYIMRTEEAMHRLMESGKLPFIKSGDVFLFRKCDLNRFIDRTNEERKKLPS